MPGGTGGPWTRRGPARPARTRAWRFGAIALALLAGLCGLAIATAGVVSHILPRRFSVAQQRQIMTWETASRWRTRPAGEIFPAAVSYRLPGGAVDSGQPIQLTAYRLGIARQASCRAATDPAARSFLDRHGCTAVLRATYVDATGSLVATIGIAVLPSPAAARAVAGDLTAAARGPQPRPGVLPVRYAGTLAAAFGAAQRQLTLAGNAGPYVFMSAVGYTDGRPRVPVSSDQYVSAEMNSFSAGVANAIGLALGAPPAVPRCPGSPGC
ncbi:MAG: hypothetical protein ACLP52_05440 [Streptosporangiaceae bacterium]